VIWINDFIAPGTTVQQPLQHTSFMRFLRTLWNIPGYLTARDQNAPDVPLTSVFSSTMRTAPWPTVTARTTFNPAGNSTNAAINELSYFVNELQQLFLSYLKTLECDVEKFFGGTCINWASSLSFSPIWLIITMIVSYMFA